MTLKATLFVKKEGVSLTVWGWMCLFICFTLGVFACVANVDSFLSYSQPIDANILIVEGWVPDYVLKEAIEQFNRGRCEFIVTTGGPLARGYHLSQHKTYAELAAASLLKMGVPEDRVKALPCPRVKKDRTRESALEVQRWLSENPKIVRLRLMTLGPHARRSYLIYRKILPSIYGLGVTSVTNEQYHPDTWWRTSAGVREIMSEGVAYLYAWCRE